MTRTSNSLSKVHKSSNHSLKCSQLPASSNSMTHVPVKLFRAKDDSDIIRPSTDKKELRRSHSFDFGSKFFEKVRDESLFTAKAAPDREIDNVSTNFSKIDVGSI